MLFSFENVAFGYGDNLIFSDVNFAVNEGERVALIGSNGEGKTTLIRLALGELAPDSGKIFVKNGIRVGYLAQNGGYTSGNTVLQEMNEVFAQDFQAIAKLEQLSAELSAADSQSSFAQLSAKIEGLNKLVSSRDSYNVDVKIRTVLNGMGFESYYNRVIDSMSGGEKTRLKLARLLLESPDLLVLDEPTNHLDIPTLFWLEDYLQSFKGAIVAVSHDRYFLDRICTRTIELEHGQLSAYPGNYTKYKQLKAERVARQQKEYEAQQQQIAKLQDYVARNIVRATTAKSAQSRVKKLEKTEVLQKPYLPPKPPEYRFTYTDRPYENVLTIKNLNLEIGGKRLISGGQLILVRGRKLALVGENGSGKTTLLKSIAAGRGEIERGRFVRIALYDQEGLNLNPENTVLAELWERHVGATQTEMRGLLARSGLFEEDMQKQVKNLSGGERAKLALCILQCENANLLLLDEPTNHLDLPARESLERALKQFDGTLLFVSHDRYFIQALADSVAEIEGQKLNVYQGDYEYYRSCKARERAEALAAEEQKKSAVREEKSRDSYRSKKDRAQEAKRKERTKQLEEQISALEGEEEEINSALANPSVTADYVKVNELTAKLSRIKTLLDGLYNEYADMIQ